MKELTINNGTFVKRSYTKAAWANKVLQNNFTKNK